MIVVMHGGSGMVFAGYGQDGFEVTVTDSNGDTVFEADGTTPKIELQMEQEEVFAYDMGVLQAVVDEISLGKADADKIGLQDLTYAQWISVAYKYKGTNPHICALSDEAELMVNSASMHWTQEAQLQAAARDAGSGFTARIAISGCECATSTGALVWIKCNRANNADAPGIALFPGFHFQIPRCKIQ